MFLLQAVVYAVADNAVSCRGSCFLLLMAFGSAFLAVYPICSGGGGTTVWGASSYFLFAFMLLWCGGFYSTCGPECSGGCSVVFSSDVQFGGIFGLSMGFLPVLLVYF